MTAEEIQAKLHTLIQPYVEDKSLLDSVKPETDLLQDLHINSAHLVDIILDAEDAFGIEIDDGVHLNPKPPFPFLLFSL